VKTVAQCMIWYLPPTMGYVYDELRAVRTVRSVVFAAHAVQPERFPLDRVYTLPSPAEMAQRATRSATVLPPFDRLWHALVREENVAALHVIDGRIAPQFLPVAPHFRLPIVTTFLGYDVSAAPNNPEYVRALQQLFEKGDLFRVLSRDMARQIRRLGCPDGKIRVIHHGIPLERYPFAPRRAPETGPVIILTAGRLIPKKGPTDLARAFARLCRDGIDVRLRIAGDGPLRPAMEAILSDAGCRDRADFLGRVEPGQLAEEMRQAHLFCLPSRVGPDGDSEGIPNVKEAMAIGLPVVSTDHAGIPELVEEGVCGYLVPEGDVTGLSDRLRCLIHRPEQWAAMGRAGRARVEAEYSLASVARQLEAEVYGPLLPE
jgi:colanic acid/amylovoran biosynthesis glycosyltransferase